MVFLNKLIYPYISRGIYIYTHTQQSAQAVYTMREIKAVEFAFALTIRHVGSLRNIFVCAKGGQRDSACPNMGVSRSRPVAWKTGCGQRKSESEME